MFEKFLQKKIKIVEDTDPDRIFVENIRRMLNTSSEEAKRICEIAVEEGVLRKRFAVECKNSDCERIIKVFDSMEDIPSEILCRTCELDGHEDFLFHKKDLNIVEFYQYI